MRFVWVLFLAFYLVFSGNVFGQVVQASDNMVSSLLEELAEDQEETPDFEELFEHMEQLKDYPININSTNEDELKQIIFLDDYKISNLLDYIQNYGDLITVYELVAVEGFDIGFIMTLLPYIKISQIKDEQKIKLKDIFMYGKNQVLLRYHQIIEAQHGYSLEKDSIISLNTNQYYFGSPAGLYVRYSYNFKNKVKAGFTLDKDPGEGFFQNSQKVGFDYSSAHLYLQNIGRIKALAIGDYKLLFGQGLTLWSGLAFGKSPEAIKLKKYSRGILAYTSTNESSLFRGIATCISVNNKIDVSIFFSKKRRDANIIKTDTLTNSELVFSSSSESGYHRTINEIARQNAIKETIYGGNISYRSKKFSTGINFYKTIFNLRQLPVSIPYNNFIFRGKENYLLSASYNYLYKQFSFFGEISHSSGGGYASLNGIHADVNPRFTLSAIHRYYSKNYHCIYCNGLSESSDLSNEYGLYIGLVALLHSRWKLNAYSDYFSFPWLKYGIDAPSKGTEHLIQLDFNASRKTFMYIRYRNKMKQQNYSDEILDYVGNIKKHNIRYHLEYSISNTLTLKNRIELLYLKIESKAPGKAILFYQDIIFTPVNRAVSIVFRYAIYDTESYETRIYAYENDVLYSFSVPGYYDEGYRYYILFKAAIFKNLTLWTRFARTKYINMESIGSGASLIEGNVKSEIKLLMRYKF